MNALRTRLLMIAALGGAAALFCGCSTPAAVRVRPWERAALADDTMNPDRDPLASMMIEHVYFSREAANGGKGVGGSGCGCN
ncbi:MAG TPA: DUF4266 domain-containing protein [Opitutaceae bacterium]|nr:DUF4266 domain-containing protein [Opitutaceae bacterium]